MPSLLRRPRQAESLDTDIRTEVSLKSQNATTIWAAVAVNANRPTVDGGAKLCVFRSNCSHRSGKPPEKNQPVYDVKTPRRRNFQFFWRRKNFFLAKHVARRIAAVAPCHRCVLR